MSTQNDKESPERAFTDVEVAEMWGLKRQTLQGWRVKGRGPRYIKFGKAVRYMASDLDEYEKAHAQEPTLQGAEQ